MKKYVLLMLFFGLAFTGFAQDWFDSGKLAEDVPGYVVTVDNDTLQGYIRYNHPPRMARKISFRTEEGSSKKTVYRGEDLKGFSFGDVFWESHEFNDGTVKLGAKQKDHYFLRPIVTGKLSVYEYYVSEIEDWVESEGNEITILPSQMKTEVWMKKEGEDLVGLNNIKFLRFHKGMSKYLSDCETLAKDIEDKKLKRNDILEIFKRYNECE